MTAVGSVLQAERERQGRTLKEVSDKINIKEIYLSALETETFTDIPGDVFVKGFIRNYANYLGLDGAALVREYKQNSLPAAANPVVQEKVKKQPKGAKPVTRERRKQGLLPEITIIAGVILFLLLCLWLIF